MSAKTMPKRTVRKPRRSAPAELDVSRSAMRSEIQAIAKRENGHLTPEAIVEAARNKRSKLHSYFTWDDGEAAEKWRLAEAGYLIRRIKLTVIRRAADEKSVVLTMTREFHSRGSLRGKGGSYEPIAEIMRDDDKQDELLQQALAELAAYRRKYAGLKLLAEVWEVLDPLLKD